MILSLDLGTKTGWALSYPTKKSDVWSYLSGVWDLSIQRGESEGMRFVRFRNLLEEVFANFQCNLVVYEDVVAHKGTVAAHIYGGLKALMIETLEQKKIDYKGFGVGEIKRFATGKGNANKERMIEAARRLFPGVHIIDDNHADALCLLALAVNKYNLAYSLAFSGNREDTK